MFKPLDCEFMKKIENASLLRYKRQKKFVLGFLMNDFSILFALD